MASRFTDTNLWKNQKWFKNLIPDFKLAFFYIKDNCDHAGVWQIDCNDLCEYTGLKSFNIRKFIEECNADHDKFSGEKREKIRIRLISEKYIWIVKFIDYQYKRKDFLISTRSPVVYSALQLLDGYGILNEGLDKGYFRLSEPFHKGMLRTKDKDKDKDKDIKDIKEGVETIKRENGKMTPEELKEELRRK